jgi:hypothetical protein
MSEMGNVTCLAIKELLTLDKPSKPQNLELVLSEIVEFGVETLSYKPSALKTCPRLESYESKLCPRHPKEVIVLREFALTSRCRRKLLE